MVGNEGIARVFALAGGGQHEAGRQVHRHILHGMHRDVGASFFQRLFQFLDEQTLAADLGQRR